MSHDIEIRRIPFDFDQVSDPVWNADRPEWSHMMNGASLAMPYLEPFLNRNLREALDHIDDPDLAEDVRGFIGQEAQHYTNHRRYNAFLRDHGYPELVNVEADHKRNFDALQQRSLKWRLAYSAGFETMTMGITEWVINDREPLFRGADPVVTSLALWHMVEETEHKSVAIDVFQAVSGSYWLRIYGLLYGSAHMALVSRRGYVAMLKRDGRWNDWRSRLRLWKTVGRFLFKASGAMLRAPAPNYHPDRVRDPAWIERWRNAYAGLGDGGIPLVDTQSEAVEPAFITAAA